MYIIHIGQAPLYLADCVSTVSSTEKKGKERKSIYIALVWPRWYTQSAQAWITQFYLQITPCLPFLRERSPDITTTAAEAIAAHYSFIDPERTKG